MTAINCDKCGANIPEGAKFCPACGAPKAEEKPEQKKSAPAPKTEPKVSKSILELIESIFSAKNMFIMIFLGLLLACIGGLIFTFAGMNLTYIRIGTIINVLGCLFIGVFLLIGGISIKSYEKFVRLGMILGGAIMVTWSLSIPA